MKASTFTVSFSPFEQLLLKSLRPLESASLLLLVWVVMHKTRPLEADWHYLRRLARDARQDQALELLIETVRDRRLDDLRLAAEVLAAADDRESHAPFLRKAIGLAASTGPLDAPTYHLLGFLADLCRTPPAALAHLYREVTGQVLVPPADPSRRSEHADPGYAAAGAGSSGARDEAGESVNANEGNTQGDDATTASAARFGSGNDYRRRFRHAWQRQTSARRRLRQWHRIRLARRTRERQARQRAEREWAERQEQARREQARRERAQWQEQQRRESRSSSDTYAGWRKRLALQVLELDERATPVEIKQAYRRLAQRHHPDRHQGLGERRIALASQRFQRIKDAYEYLTQHA